MLTSQSLDGSPMYMCAELWQAFWGVVEWGCDRREASHENFRRARAKFRIDVKDVMEIDRGNNGERRDNAAKDVRM